MEKIAKLICFYFRSEHEKNLAIVAKSELLKRRFQVKILKHPWNTRETYKKNEKKHTYVFINLFSDWVHKIYQHQGGRDQEDRGRGEEEQGGAASTGELNLSVWSWYWLLVSSFEISIEQVQLWALHFPKRLFRSISTSRPWPCCWWPGPQSRQSSSSPR